MPVRGQDCPPHDEVPCTPAILHFVLLLLKIWLQPAGAMSAILDRGSLLFASVAALVATVLLKFAVPTLPFSFYMPLLVLAVVFVPGLLVLASMLGKLGGVGV